jgi:protein-L-isoaspartate O-methyltransferase
MNDCCQSDYAGMFNGKRARKKANAYRKKGLDGQSAQMVSFLTTEPLDGATVLEVGGGVGALQVELLKAGADRIVSVELSTEYEPVAQELLAEADLENRVDRRVGDFVAMNDELSAADIVVLNRVICCYPDMPALLGAACSHARSRVVITVPREKRLLRAGMALANLWFRLRRSAFRVFVHSKEGMIAEAGQHGFEQTAAESGRVWDVILFERGDALSSS